MSTDVPEHSLKKESISSSHLHQESAELMSSRPIKRAIVSLDLDEDGRYKVMDGNSLSSIAKRALAMRGKPSDDWHAVESEMDRIVAMNEDRYPSLKTNRAFIRQGWNLQIWDKTMGPDATCEWKPWKEAPSEQWTVVGKCERVLAPNQAWLIVQPGGQAVLNPGSKAFVAPKASIKMAMPGSFIVDTGGEISDYGATIQKLDASAKEITGD